MKKRSFQIEYLKRFAPDLAKVRWQPFDADLYEYKYFNTWLLPRRIIKKIRRTLSGQTTIQRNWEVHSSMATALRNYKNGYVHLD